MRIGGTTRWLAVVTGFALAVEILSRLEKT
jgi:hypothetical protein